jgi:hypothetical protein
VNLNGQYAKKYRLANQNKTVFILFSEMMRFLTSAASYKLAHLIALLSGYFVETGRSSASITLLTG